MNDHEFYMHRCLQLAAMGTGRVAPNPMVGAVLVHDGRMIGEGYHRHYGGAHAEVNCLASVREQDKSLVPRSTLYVSLEPCAHHGKTPPCADLIIRNKIPRVVIGVRDPFAEVNGRGMEKLRAAGIEVIMGILEESCTHANRRFFCFHTLHRPYIVLKWAETADGRIAPEDRSRLRISNEFTNRIVHRWRSEEMAIIVGARTALHDDPELTTRLWPGRNPLRLVIDMDLRLPEQLKLFSSGGPTIVFNLHRHTLPFEKTDAGFLQSIGLAYYQVTADVSLVHQVLNALYRMNVQSLLVEGGAQLLQRFIDEGCWDEARVIRNQEMTIGSGLAAPVLSNQLGAGSEQVFSDKISYYAHHTPKHEPL